MSLYTITFDDDEESSDSPMPMVMPVKKTPQFKRPPNIVTKPSPKPTINRTPIQKMQMIITDSDSYDDSGIKSIPTFGKELVSTSKNYSEYSDENSAPKSPKIHVKDIETDSEYYYSDGDENQPKFEIKTSNSPPQPTQNKSQPFRRSPHQPQQTVITQQPRQVPEEEQQQNLMDQLPEQQQHHHHRRQTQPSSQPPQNQPQIPQEPNQQDQQSQGQQIQLRPQVQKSKSQDIHQNQNKDFNHTDHKNEIVSTQPEFPPDNLPFPLASSSVPRNNFNKPLIPYRLQRTSLHSIRGKRTHYQLFQGKNPILHTKVKQGKTDELYITSGTETHFKDGNYKAVFLSANHNTTFSLREKTSIGKELMIIRYLPGGDNEPRNVTVHFNDFGGHPIDFQNRKARLTSHNLWILDLRGRLALKSIKNCIVVDENNEEVMIVLKAEVDTLNIEAREEITDIEVMAMGLSAFLCKK